MQRRYENPPLTPDISGFRGSCGSAPSFWQSVMYCGIRPGKSDFTGMARESRSLAAMAPRHPDEKAPRQAMQEKIRP